MRFLKSVLPNLSLALSLALVVVVYLDRRNPMMGFLMGAPFFVLVVLTAAASVVTALVLYCSTRKSKKSKRKTEKVEIDS